MTTGSTATLQLRREIALAAHREAGSASIQELLVLIYIYIYIYIYIFIMSSYTKYKYNRTQNTGKVRKKLRTLVAPIWTARDTQT